MNNLPNPIVPGEYRTRAGAFACIVQVREGSEGRLCCGAIHETERGYLHGLPWYECGALLGREWHLDGRLFEGSNSCHDLVECVAVFERKDPPKPNFHITGPGRYRTRNGGAAIVVGRDPDDPCFPWIGRADSAGGAAGWMENGRLAANAPSFADIVERTGDL